MNIYRRVFGIIIITAMLCCINQAWAAPSSTYSDAKVSGISVKYVTLDMNNHNIQPVILNAQNQMCGSDSLANMAKTAGTFAAINGTYFEAY
ncbi:MAG: hypothetical protein PHE26_06320, partial [Syntrophomonadaceae bacterium]|nr:hypothetical protein [Syntrophomonadaceae bacterium]